MRHTRTSSSSSDSLSSPNHSKQTRRHKSSKSKRNRSRSTSRTKSSYDKKHHRSSDNRHRRRRHSTSSTSSSRSRSRSPGSKSARKSSSNHHKKSRSRHRSSSQSSNSQSHHSTPKQQDTMPKSSDKYRAKIDNMQREKNFEFKESVEELHRSEQGRMHVIEKIDKSDAGDGFKPQSFKSSRSMKKSGGGQSSDQTTVKSTLAVVQRRFTETKAEDYSMKLVAPVEVSVVNASSKSLMHESLFEDIMVKEKRWKQKLLGLLKTAIANESATNPILVKND